MRANNSIQQHQLKLNVDLNLSSAALAFEAISEPFERDIHTTTTTTTTTTTPNRLLAPRATTTSSLFNSLSSSSDSSSSSPSSYSPARTAPIAPTTIKSPHDRPKLAASNHLLQLQKEIKEEEEEIFADINSLINSRSSNLYSKALDYCDEDEEDVLAKSGLNLDYHDRHQSTFHTITPPPSIRTPNATADSPTTRSPLQQKDNHTNNNINLSSFHHLHHHPSTRHHHHHHIDDSHQLFLNRSDDLTDQNLSADDTTITNSTHDYNNESTSALGGYPASGSSESLSGDQYRNYPHHRQPHERFPVEETSNQNYDFMCREGDCQDQPQKTSNESNILANLHHNYETKTARAENTTSDGQYPFTTPDSNRDEQIQDYQALRSVIQQVTSNLPKPCVFFLEGNCRRSDCKYSHDLSNITCKYWIEGFCFKGEMCPFLHSYTPNDTADSMDEDGLEALSKRELNPTFVLQSEADFPSLPFDAPASNLNDSVTSTLSADVITDTIKNQILSSNPAVVFKTVKKKRKRG